MFLRSFVVTTSHRVPRRQKRERAAGRGGKLSVASFLWDFHRGIHDLLQGFNQPIKDLDVWSCHKTAAMKKESVFAAYLYLLNSGGF